MIGWLWLMVNRLWLVDRLWLMVDRFWCIHWLWNMVCWSWFMVNRGWLMIYWSRGMISRSRGSIGCRSWSMNSMVRTVNCDTDTRVTRMTMTYECMVALIRCP